MIEATIIYDMYTIDSNNKLDIMGFVWMDQNRTNFVANASSTTYHGTSFLRSRLYQVDKSPNANPVMITNKINQP